MAELPALVQALLTSEAYPHRPSKIELVQTQMSFIFLTGDYVYKVKKAVNLGYLDYTTLERRKHFCHQEVILNRRLCPEVYLDVVAISQEDGKVLIEGKKEAIEYAVKMRQLPQQRTMDNLLRNNQVTKEMIARVAQRIAEFHQSAETNEEISGFGDLSVVVTNTEENFTQTEKYIGVSIPREKYDAIKSYTQDFINNNASLFGRRIKKGKIRDCHGDLHAAHVCFTDSICIFDCIEFNDRFRYSDVASEIAFLAMDLDYHGRPDLSQHFVATYQKISGDREMGQLIDFYKCYRAYVRGKVESFKLDDPHIPREEKEETLSKAIKYFDLAYSYIKSEKPTLFITTGLIGSGKTVLAEALSQRRAMAVISSDDVRKRLANIPPDEHRFEEFDSGIYSSAFSRKTYDEMLRQAKQILKAGQSVIIDASFRKAKERRKAMKLAQEIGAAFKAIECRCNEETIKERLSHRFEESSISDGRLELLPQLKEDFEPVSEVALEDHIMVDSSRPVEETVKELLERIEH